MNTITPVNFKSKIYVNGTKNKSSVQAINLKQENNAMPSFKARSINKSRMLAAFFTFVTMIASKLAGINNSDFDEAKSIDSVNAEALQNQKYKTNGSSYNIYNNHMILNIVKLLQTEPEQAISLSGFLRNLSINTLRENSDKEVTNEDVDYLTSKFLEDPNIDKYSQYCNFEDMIKALRIKDENREFFDNYSLKKIYNNENARNNIKYIDKIYQLQKENLSVYNLFMASEFNFSAEEMLNLKDVYTEKTDTSIRKVIEISSWRQKKQDYIATGLLHELYPEQVESWMKKLNTCDSVLIKTMIDHNNDDDFKAYMLYTSHSVSTTTDKKIKKAEEYSADAKKYKLILDKLTANIEDEQKKSRTKIEFVEKYLSIFGERIDYIPESENELKIIQNLCEKYNNPTIKITKKMVDLAKLPNSGIFDLSKI